MHEVEMAVSKLKKSDDTIGTNLQVVAFKKKNLPGKNTENTAERTLAGKIVVGKLIQSLS